MKVQRMKTINAGSFEVLVDNNDENIVGLQVNPLDSASFVLPMARSTAKDVGLLLLVVK
jgi:hypothetical protein